MELLRIEDEDELEDIVLLASSPEAAEPDVVVRASSGALIHVRPDGAFTIVETRSKSVFPSGASRIVFSTGQNPSQPSRAWLGELVDGELSVFLLTECDGTFTVRPVGDTADFGLRCRSGPRCLCASPRLARLGVDFWGDGATFVAAFREASAAFRGGRLDVVFPAYSFRPGTTC